MTVPIPTSPGRSGFGPQLSLSYDSGAGNGPYGFGWNLSLPSITRKTDKGLPSYDDANESDVFILSGAEDLVPEFEKDPTDQWILRDGKNVVHDKHRIVDRISYRVRRYRPRTEGLFARIERWTNTVSGEIHWRSISKDNITTLYGRDNYSRIFDTAELDKGDPADLSKAHPTRIFSWLICQSYDDKGNVLVYDYKPEDSKRIFDDLARKPISKTHERNRTDETRSAQRYLKRIRYGNRVPYFPELKPNAPWPEPPGADATDASQHWLFEVVFDYDEGHYSEDSPDSQGRVIARAQSGTAGGSPWRVRNDPFSSCRAGFEVRTYRRCQRVLMFHHFPGEAEVGPDCLVRSTDFTYSDAVDPTNVRNPVYSFLKGVTQNGYRRNNGGYDKRSLPPVEFKYTQPIVQDEVEEVDPHSLENLPIGLDGSAYRWTDLHGEGIPGILTEQAGAWYYKRNLSPIPTRNANGTEQVKARFSPIETVFLKPNLALGSGAEFMDLAGDGQPDVVIMDGAMPGLYEHDEAEGWQPFRPFSSRLNRDLRDPNLKLIDLDGDGHADVLITEDDAFVWHSSQAEEGFGPARRVTRAFDEERGPRIVFADGTQSIYLVDLSGDGLTDLVRIRNGEVCYWPNLGYGRFGAKVTMDNSPWFDHPDQFDQKRIRLADIDGSGTTDIIYLHRDGVRLYFNQSGNSWSQPNLLKVFLRVDDLVDIVPTDLLGNGTACLVWSSPLPGDARRQMRYVNLMGSQKPHLLVATINNLGAETRVEYAPSTKFYLEDKRDGNPWITRLPFPVHVVEKVVTYDHISRNRFITRYAYHHGYFDGDEREFRGFGMVEQWDTEEFASLAPIEGEDWAEGATTNLDVASHVPPVHTKTWFHTGAYLGRVRTSRLFEEEYFREDGLTIETARPLLLDDTVFPAGLTLDEEREACRALKGSMLRQELYADDALPGATAAQIQRARTPYTVTEQNFTIKRLQPRPPSPLGWMRAEVTADHHHAVFFTHTREVISYHYERNPADPRIQHVLTLEVDQFGNVLKEATIGYGRRERIRVVDAQGNLRLVSNPGLAELNTADQAKQTTPLLTYTENRVTNAIDSADTHRNPLPCESVTFELTGYAATGPADLIRRFQASDFVEPDPGRLGRVRHRFTAPEVAYEATAAGNRRRRPVEQIRTLYREDNLTALLPLGDLQSLALPGESYKLAFTPELLSAVFKRKRPDGSEEGLLAGLPASFFGGTAGDEGGYVHQDGDNRWWIPSGRSYFSEIPTDAATELAEARHHFFLPRRYRDPFGKETTVKFDEPAKPNDPRYDLLVVETRDALGNRVTVEANDYRVLQPRLIRDPNGNRSEVAFDTLGLVVGTAVMGKATGPVEGDLLTGFVAEVVQSDLDQFIAAPRQPSADPKETEATPIVHTLLGNATTRIVYDLNRFHGTKQANPNNPDKWEPPFAATILRETHISDLPAGQKSKLQVSFSYSDGFGREIQKKIQAEPGNGRFADAVMADNPVAYFRLGEAAGAKTARDSSGHGRHATVSEDPSSGRKITLGVPGLGSGDTAAFFDGQDDCRIVVPDSPALHPNRVTIEAIISWAGPNGFHQRILERSFSAASYTWPTYGLSVLPDGSVYVELTIAGRPLPDSVTSKARVIPKAPTHLAATYDGKTIKIYINGVLDASQAVAGDIVTTSGPGDVGIGNQVERKRPFNGVIDEVALYDQALSADRIQSHFAKIKLPRWVGSGWTIFNNKGKPVRQYEPSFSPTHRFEFGVAVGVSPVLFYDPIERVVATLHPNHTYEKVVFDPWKQTTYDVNDTCGPRNLQTGDPRTDPDIGGYTAEYFKTQPVDWKTWIQQRIEDPQHPPVDSQGKTPESDAAVRALAHADTPTTAHFDALGRPFVTVVRNRVACANHPLNGKPIEAVGTRIELDIEGNQREVRDERQLTDADGLPLGALEQREVMHYTYDLLGNRIHQLSMEAGARWMLNDVVGKPIRAWDSRGHNFATTYDALRRPIGQFVRGMFSDPDPLKSNSDPRTLNPSDKSGLLIDKIEYGEPLANATLAQEAEAQRLNLRTRIYRHLDSAGEVVNAGTNINTGTAETYDFKGNLRRSTRRLAKDYKGIPDWSQNSESQLDSERFEASARYDALNRPIQSISPHSNLARATRNIIQPVFNEANLLDGVDVWLEWKVPGPDKLVEPAGLLNPKQQTPSSVGVANIDYDAKGQRLRIDYKTQDTRVIRTTYAYDRETFRLTNLYTRRGVDRLTAEGVAFTEDCDNPRPPPLTIAAPGIPPQGKSCGLQNLRYTYDPAGNITHIRDDAQQTIFFKNKIVDPSNDYTYDAQYRLIEARGREHLGQAGGAPISHSYNDAGRVGIEHANPPGRFAPNDGNVMGTYIERYIYDAVGNFQQMQHRGDDPAHPGWTRAYEYLESSLIEDGRAPRKTSNRLTRTTLNPNGSKPPQVEPYSHDVHGNMLSMPQLQEMQWDYKDQLRLTRRQRVNDEDTEGIEHEGERTYYVYDTSGQRVRKVCEKSTGRTEERIYLGGFEIFRRHQPTSNGAIDATTLKLERETLHVMDDKQRIAMVETQTRELGSPVSNPQSLIRYQLGNHLGSAVLELDDQAQIISYEEYAPYGSSTYQAVRSQTEAPKRYRYAGKERDEESGLSYHEARYYAGWLGTWVRCDPTGVSDGPALFSYCRSNPVGFVDLTGNSAWDTVGGYYVGFFDWLVGPSDLTFKSEDFKAAYHAIYADPRRQIAKDVSGNPASAVIAGATLGLVSGFVPGAPDGSDLPVSMQESYRMSSFASKNATAIVEGLQGMKSIPPAASPPQVATAGAAVALPRTLAIPAVTVESVHMAVSAASGTSAADKKPSKGYEAGDRHPATDKEVLGRLERPDRSSATTQPGNPKLDEQVMAAKPSTKLDPPPVVTLENSGRHDPSSTSYASDKSVMPAVDKQVELFNKSVAASHNGQTIPARVALDDSGNVHQFHASGPNNYHWAGQQGGVTKTGEPVGIDPSKLSYFRRLLNFLGE